MKTMNFIKNNTYLLLIMLIASQTISCMNNPNINAQNHHGNTRLHDATAEGNIDRILELLDKGANPNIQNNHGQTPIYLAISHTSKSFPEPRRLKKIEVLQTLLDNPQTDPNIATSYGPALFYAVNRKEPYAVQALLNDPRINPTLTNNVGQTAAEFAHIKQEEVISNMIQQAIDNYSPNEEPAIKIARHL